MIAVAAPVAARVVVDLVAGGVAAAVLWLALRSTFAAPIFARSNHRGASVPVGAGVVAVVAVTGVAAVGAVLDTNFLRVPDRYLLVAAGFGLLGLLDDVAAVGDERGFRGHLSALAQGRLTTGGLKLVGGGLLALALAAGARPDWSVVLVLDALLIALAANLGNLFDRAPGRTTKVTAVAFALLWALNPFDALDGAAAVVGAGIGLLIFDLREDLMLGDAGANVLGAVVGLAVVDACSLPVRVAVLLVVAALNLASERVSFSRVIDEVGLLRVLDRLGRRP